MNTKLLINGRFVTGKGKIREKILDPASGAVIAEIPEASDDQTAAAVAAAAAAFPSWARTTPKDRGAHAAQARR